MPADNVADEPANRRGPKPLPLKAGEWNAVKLSLKANTVTLELNGQTVYERPLESTLGRQFGLFHYKDQTAAQVRNIVLRGQWPEALPNNQLDDLLALDPSAPSFRFHPSGPTRGDRRAPLRSWSGRGPREGRETASRRAVCTAGGLGTAQSRSPGLSTRRQFQPDRSQPPGLSTTTSSAKAADGGRRVVRIQSGGEPRAPAIELVDTAKALGKLDELAKRIDSIKFRHRFRPRCQRARQTRLARP